MGTTAIGKYTEVIKRPELGALSGVKCIYGTFFFFNFKQIF